MFLESQPLEQYFDTILCSEAQSKFPSSQITLFPLGFWPYFINRSYLILIIILILTILPLAKWPFLIFSITL